MGAPRRANRGSNKNDVPFAAERRALNTWLLGTHGDGITVPCSFCQRQLLFSEITRDRFPIPGRKGGRYVKGNIRAACMSCNAADGARQGEPGAGQGQGAAGCTQRPPPRSIR